MVAYVKRSGNWTNVTSAWVKSSGIWTLSTAGYFKINGVWTQVYSPPATPPQPPIISVEDRRTSAGIRYLSIGARYPGVISTTPAHLRTIRVLVSTSPLTSQFGSGFVTTPSTGYPNEPWSDWYYQDVPGVATKGHDNASEYDFKFYLPNRVSSLQANKQYYIGGWCMNDDGQWSAGTLQQLFLPSEFGVGEPTVWKTLLLRPSKTTSVDPLSGNFVVPSDPGYARPTMYWKASTLGTQRLGVSYFGSRITNAVGPNVLVWDTTQCRLWVRRIANDPLGAATEDLWVGYHIEPDTSTPVDGATDVRKLGTLNKGSQGNFQIPNVWLDPEALVMNELKGFVMFSMATSGTNAITATGIDEDLQSFQLQLRWGEPA